MKIILCILLLLWGTTSQAQPFVFLSIGQNFNQYHQIFDEAYAFSQAPLPQKNQLVGVGGGYRWSPNWDGVALKIGLELGRGLYTSIHYKTINQTKIYRYANDLTFYLKQSIALQLPIWHDLSLDIGINANHYRFYEQVKIIMLNRDVVDINLFWLFGTHVGLNYQLSPTWYINIKADWMIPTNYDSHAINTVSPLETKIRFTDASLSIQYRW